MIFAGQLGAFIITVLAGMLVGVIFDIFRIVRGRLSFGCYFTSLADLLFWLLATVVVFAAFVFGNWGEVRLYMFIGLLSGVLIYYRLCSRAVMKTVVIALGWLTRTVNALKLLISFLFKPFLMIGSLVHKAIRFLVSKIRFKKIPPDANIPPE